MNTYVARYDDGHDFGEFTYQSDHKAGSRENWEDARSALRRRYGASFARHNSVIEVALCDEYDNPTAPYTDVRHFGEA